MPLPSGTVTFLRSDIEGSMALVRALGARYDAAGAQHADIVRTAVREHAGHVVRTEGDAFFAVFTEVAAAARAAVDIQRAMARHAWPDDHQFRVRIGIHTGTATHAGDDYGGFEVSRAARIAGAGHGGQIVLSAPSRALLAPEIPDDWAITDLGRHRLKGIAEPEPLFGLVAPGLEREFAPLRSTVGTEHLPRRAVCLIGREVELAETEALLGATRLLTLTGPGGSGKTALALALARRRAADHEDGAWFVDLQAVHDPARVRSEVAHGLGLHDGAAGRAVDRLHDYVADRDMLVVVDNFEQVADAATELAALLDASSRSCLIVTSRVPLHLTAEQEYPVRPLALAAGHEDATPEAVRLFVERARRVRPGLELDEDDMSLVERICRLVDGLPLAIELCAARVSLLPLAAIHDRLEQRSPLPGSGQRDRPPRQRTIDDTVAWSYDLLEPPLQRLLTRLSVFSDSFELQQAEAVCGPPDELGVDVLDGLVALTEQWLITREDHPSGGIRYGVLETIGAFGLHRLEESGGVDAMRQRHAQAFADLAEEAAPHWRRSQQPRWVARLEADDANLRAAVRTAIARGDEKLALRLVACLWRYWLTTGRLAEGRELAQSAIALPGAEQPCADRLSALDAVGGIAYWSGDVEAADAWYREQLELARALGDSRGEAQAWLNLSFTRRILGDIEGYEAAEATALRHFEAQEDDEMILVVLWSRVQAFTLPTDAPSTHDMRGGSVEQLEEVAARLEARGDRWSRGQALGVRGQLELRRGHGAEALRTMVESSRIGLELRVEADILLAMQPVVVLLLAAGMLEVGATVLGAVQAETERYGILPPASFERMTGIADPAAAFRQAMGPEDFHAAYGRGRHMPLETALDLIESVIPDVPEDLGAIRWSEPRA